MKNKTLFLLTTVLLTLTLVLGVTAADITVSANAKGEPAVSVNSDSNYHPTDLFNGFKNIMPGDNLNDEITIENNYRGSDYVEVRMYAVPHGEKNPLQYSEPYEETDGKDQPPVISGERDETIETMREFLNQMELTLSYTDENGGRVTLGILKKDENGVPVKTEAKNDLTGDGILLAALDRGEDIKLTLNLTVPITMGNEFANRVGEIDWVFAVTPRNYPDDDPIRPNHTVRKVWEDGGIGRPASIEVILLRSGMAYDTVTLSERNNWTYTWSNLDYRYEWSVEEEVPEGYVATYKTNGSGWVTTITNTKILADELTVEKVWVDGDSADRPASVDVVLLCDGEYFDEVELNDRNDWTYTWENLSVNDSWSVLEKSVPEGYHVSYSFDNDEDKVIVTNTLEEPEPTELTVTKVWEGEGEHPDSVKVYLLCDGELTDSAELTAAAEWTYTWEDLPAEHSWSVVENEVAGYIASYAVDGTDVTITNTKVVVKEPYDLTVKKVWSDEGNENGRPASVNVVLYNGETAVETVVLSAANGWIYTWTALDADGNWQVMEDDIPTGYVPSYEVADGVVTITNTAILIQTGQTKWPIPVLCIGGILLIGTGLVMMTRKRKNHAE